MLNNCRHHGKLKPIHLVKSGIVNGKQQYKCKLCLKKLHQNHYQRNKEAVNSKAREYKKKNPDKQKQYRINERIKYKETYREKQLKSWREMNDRNINGDWIKQFPKSIINYAKQSVCKRTLLSVDDIPDEVAYAFIAIQYLKRTMKKLRR